MACRYLPNTQSREMSSRPEQRADGAWFNRRESVWAHHTWYYRGPLWGSVQLHVLCDLQHISLPFWLWSPSPDNTGGVYQVSLGTQMPKTWENNVVLAACRVPSTVHQEDPGRQDCKKLFQLVLTICSHLTCGGVCRGDRQGRGLTIWACQLKLCDLEQVI